MNILYFDTIGGISGDMMVAALLNFCKNDEFLLANLKKLPLNPWQWQHKTVKKGEFTAEKIDFILEKSQPCRHLEDIEKIIKAADFPKKITTEILGVFALLATAESIAHGIEKRQVHFHEVGADDTILDIAGVILLLNYLKIDQIYASPLPMGKGLSMGCHGMMPHPAPGLNYLLENVAVYGIEEETETVTPTGIALLKYLDCTFGTMPPMTIEKIGVGCGTKDLKRPNILRCFLGAPNQSINEKITETHKVAAPQISKKLTTEVITQGDATTATVTEETDKYGDSYIFILKCTIDDMTGEELGFLWEKIYAVGAKDMTFNSVFMKKARPGQTITVLVEEEDLTAVRDCLFAHTSTIGITCTKEKRFKMTREIETVATPYGEIDIKIATGYGIKKIKPEYNDIKNIALKNNISLKEVAKAAITAYNEEHNK
ncbi:MAG: nickel pincer cofactor biosynthesis protein LarC [Clostridiales bacterium]